MKQIEITNILLRKNRTHQIPKTNLNPGLIQQQEGKDSRFTVTTSKTSKFWKNIILLPRKDLISWSWEAYLEAEIPFDLKSVYDILRQI